MGKKIYCTPTTEVLELEVESLMLQSSSGGDNIKDGVEVGGEVPPSGSFDGKQRGFDYDW